MAVVFKTSVSLDPDVYKRVTFRKMRTNVPVSRLVNRALRAYLARLDRLDRGEEDSKRDTSAKS